jgi:hypothetical protein
MKDTNFVYHELVRSHLSNFRTSITMRWSKIIKNRKVSSLPKALENIQEAIELYLEPITFHLPVSM